MSSMDVKGKKLCWNCDGDVHMYAIQCPFCGVDLTESNQAEEGKNFESPYQFVSPTQTQPDLTPPQGQYTPSSPQESLEKEEPPPQKEEGEEAVLDPQFKQSIKPMLLLLPGGLFFAFTFLLIFFSNSNGEVVLKWKSALWPFYLLIALPMLYYGWKALRQIEE